MKKNQNGFSVVEVLIIVIVLGIVSFGGWYVLRSHDKENDTRTTTSEGKKREDKGTSKADESPQLVSFDCKGAFTLKLPEGFEGLLNDETEQCVVTNADKSDWPAVAPFPPAQTALFFNVNETNMSDSSLYLEQVISGNSDYPSTIKSKGEVRLDNGDKAALFLVNGGHPIVRDYFSFAYIKNGKVVTTSYEANSDNRTEAVAVLKSIVIAN